MYGGDMPPTARGCLRQQAGVTGIHYHSIGALCNFNNEVVLLALLRKDVLSVDE